MRAVNLLPREDTRRTEARKPDRTVAMIGIIGGGIVVLALAIGFVVAGRCAASYWYFPLLISGGIIARWICNRFPFGHPSQRTSDRRGACSPHTVPPIP